MKIRTVIVEDEPVARKRIKRFLAEDAEIEIIAECEDGNDAVNVIDSLKPDLVFLDIQIPELDGFGVLKALKAEQKPVIVFVTAFDKYAIRAFEFHALDYLLKPFERERLESTLTRVKSQIREREKDNLEERLLALIEGIKPERKYQERVAIKSGGEVLFLKTEEIDWIEPAGNYLRLHVGKESYLIRETMNAMEEKLDSGMFLRIQRSVIVNSAKIKKLSPLFRGEYVVILQDGKRLMSSRGYRENLEQFINSSL